MIVDIEELEEMDVSELHVRRPNANEVLTSMKGNNFMFAVADGTVKISGGDQRLRPSTLIWDSQTEEMNKKFFKESQTDYFLQLHFKISQHFVIRNLKMISGLLRETSLIVITWKVE